MNALTGGGIGRRQESDKFNCHASVSERDMRPTGGFLERGPGCGVQIPAPLLETGKEG